MVYAPKKKNSISPKLVLECLICHCLPADSARPGPVWLRGDLPVRATGARLHHRCCYPCHRVPAQVHLWHKPRPIQWTHCTDLCEEELRLEDCQLHAASVHCRMTILQIRRVAALPLTISPPRPPSLSPDCFGDLLSPTADKHWHACGQYRHNRLSHHRQGNQCLLE